jgi:hypothetical protein
MTNSQGWIALLMSKDSSSFSGERGLERSRSKCCQKGSYEPVEYLDTTRDRVGGAEGWMELVEPLWRVGACHDGGPVTVRAGRFGLQLLQVHHHRSFEHLGRFLWDLKTGRSLTKLARLEPRRRDRFRPA